MTFPSKVFMPFVVLGDPSYEESLSIITALVDNGAGALELGFPFSDPIADGPAVQAANLRSLCAGMTTEKCFALIEEVRSFTSVPISVMLSYNIVHRYGVDAFYARCAVLGVDAVLCPDVPLEESGPLIDAARAHGIAQVPLVSPMTSPSRIAELCEDHSGYVYLVSVMGTTGARSSLATALPAMVRGIKAVTSLPVYVGFGISQPEHVKRVLSLADGAICGSAICELIREGKDVGAFCKSMSRVL